MMTLWLVECPISPFPNSTKLHNCNHEIWVTLTQYQMCYIRYYIPDKISVYALREAQILVQGCTKMPKILGHPKSRIPRSKV